MKIRKIMTAITAAAMAGVMFAGCSSNNGGSSAGSSADSSSAANSSSATDNGGAENNGTGSGEVSLTVWGSQEDQEPQTYSHSLPIRLRSWLMQERSTESPRIRIR